MRSFKTLSKSHPEFNSYLDGSFSGTHVAVPVRSLNVNTSNEEVTFEVLSLEELQAPSRLRIAWMLVRPESLAFSIGPMIAVLASCIARGFKIDFGLAVTAFFGVIAFHLAVNLFNDVNDHIQGRDRMRSQGGSRVLQFGWARAVNVRRVAWLLACVALFCGLPSLISGRAWIVAGAATLVGFELVFQKFKLQARGWAEGFAFLLMGPLLTSGYAWSFTGQLIWDMFVLGAIFGSTALMYFHSANFENIMPDRQAGVRTWATRTGFDASKNFFYFTAALVLMASAFFVIGIERKPQLSALIVSQLAFLIPVVLRVSRLSSPLASALNGLRSEAARLSWISVIALVCGYLWLSSTGSVVGSP